MNGNDLSELFDILVMRNGSCKGKIVLKFLKLIICKLFKKAERIKHISYLYSDKL